MAKVKVLRANVLYHDGRLQPKGAELEVDDKLAKAWAERDLVEIVKMGKAKGSEKEKEKEKETKPEAPTENTTEKGPTKTRQG